ncbi:MULTISPECIES: tRNA (mnm(5)s(2)U34)-methyltransferase [Listeria]|uniref:tRNA (mnm(5)s(2)U34)-methyltransferase n=1 Tax=Listeria TaxID=1637 RepID=UPI000B589190|nr:MULTISPECIES: class I SAM-dependent methyltransferase [Listeria]
MNLDGILPFSHGLLKKIIFPGDAVIDATCGNGHDTLFLAELVGTNGCVYAFDIQNEAVQNTATRLTEANCSAQVKLFQKSHAEIENCVPVPIKAAIYNLGYLPGGNKSITTLSETTISSIEQALAKLLPGGIVILVIYHGHDAGKTEKKAVLNYAESLPQKDFHVLRYGFINQQNNPPFVVAIEKRERKN